MTRLSRAALPAAALALAAGLATAWVDTRPSWDDTGVTVGAVALAAAAAGLVGCPPWLAALLVAAPMILAELPTTAAVLVALPIALVGAYAGALARRALGRATT